MPKLLPSKSHQNHLKNTIKEWMQKVTIFNILEYQPEQKTAMTYEEAVSKLL